MDDEQKKFWTWLQKTSRFSIVVRILIEFVDKGDHRSITRFRVHLFYQDKSHTLYLLQLRLEDYYKLWEPHKHSIQQITEAEQTNLLRLWGEQRLEDWTRKEELVATYTNSSYTTFCPNGFIVQEVLSQTFGFFQGADPSGQIPEYNTLLTKLAGLRRLLRNDLTGKIKVLQEFAFQFQNCC